MTLPPGADGGRPRLLYVVTEDWFFLSHRLPMARAAQAAGFEVHVATNVADGAAAIAREGFVLHPVRFAPRTTLAARDARDHPGVAALHRDVAPDLVHHVALQPTVLGSLAAVGLPVARVNAITGLGYAFISESSRPASCGAVIGTLLRLLVDRRRSVALVQNPDDRDCCCGLGIAAERIVLIPGSGVDVDRLSRRPSRRARSTLGFVGRLLDDKGIRILVAAHRLLRQKGLAVDLLIAGTPDPANQVAPGHRPGGRVDPGRHPGPAQWLPAAEAAPGLSRIRQE